MGSELQSSKISAGVLTNASSFWMVLSQKCSYQAQHAQCTEVEKSQDSPSRPLLTQEPLEKPHPWDSGTQGLPRTQAAIREPRNLKKILITPPPMSLHQERAAAYHWRQAKSWEWRERFPPLPTPHSCRHRRKTQLGLLKAKSEAGILRWLFQHSRPHACTREHQPTAQLPNGLAQYSTLTTW